MYILYIVYKVHYLFKIMLIAIIANSNIPNAIDLSNTYIVVSNIFDTSDYTAKYTLLIKYKNCLST